MSGYPAYVLYILSVITASVYTFTDHSDASVSSTKRVSSKFLPRDAADALGQCKAQSCDRMSSVRLSVTLVDQDHIGWQSWKLIARTISPTPSLFVSQRPSTYIFSGTWGHFRETIGGVGKTLWSLTLYTLEGTWESMVENRNFASGLLCSLH